MCTFQRQSQRAFETLDKRGPSRGYKGNTWGRLTGAREGPPLHGYFTQSPLQEYVTRVHYKSPLAFRLSSMSPSRQRESDRVGEMNRKPPLLQAQSLKVKSLNPFEGPLTFISPIHSLVVLLMDYLIRAGVVEFDWCTINNE